MSVNNELVRIYALLTVALKAGRMAEVDRARGQLGELINAEMGEGTVTHLGALWAPIAMVVSEGQKREWAASLRTQLDDGADAVHDSIKDQELEGR